MLWNIILHILVSYSCCLHLLCYAMLFNATFNNISAILWLSVLLLEETGENHRPAASHWQTLSHNVVSSIPRLSGIRTHNVRGDRHWLHMYICSYKSNYHTITTAPLSSLELDYCLHNVTDDSVTYFTNTYYFCVIWFKINYLCKNLININQYIFFTCAIFRSGVQSS